MKGKQLISVVLAAKKTSLKLLTTTMLLASVIPTGQSLAQAVDYTQSVPVPPDLNPGLTSPSAEYMENALGRPGESTEDCSPITNPDLLQSMIPLTVGADEVEGYRPAVEAVQRILTKVQQEKPELYSQLGSEGMLCVRQVRGSSGFSNHAWGSAIDIRIGDKTDVVGDGLVQQGLLELAPYFNAEGFYWGAAYAGEREDSMHFEASEELVAEWTSGENPVPPVEPTLPPPVEPTPVPKTQFNFETPEEGWSFAGGAGLDYDKGFEHSGRGNGWVRNTSGWNAINNLINVEPNSECSVTAWLRTSDTLTDGYMSVRPYNGDGSVGSVINEIKLIGAGAPNPQNRGYNLYTLNFNPGNNNKVLFYAGLWGNGNDSWIQIDDVEFSCVSPAPQPPTPPAPQPPIPPTDINQAGLDLIKEFEGYAEELGDGTDRVKAYRDTNGILTIGWGHTGPDVVEGMIITPEQAEELLRGDLQEFKDAVSNLVTVPLNENQFSALVSLTYNVGAGDLENSQLLVLLNQGDYQKAADEFRSFNTDENGVVLDGLIRRRERERELFLAPPVAPDPPVEPVQ